MNKIMWNRNLPSMPLPIWVKWIWMNFDYTDGLNFKNGIDDKNTIKTYRNLQLMLNKKTNITYIVEILKNSKWS
jgi:hypothetical protein